MADCEAEKKQPMVVGEWKHSQALLYKHYFSLPRHFYIHLAELMCTFTLFSVAYSSDSR